MRTTLTTVATFRVPVPSSEFEGHTAENIHGLKSRVASWPQPFKKYFLKYNVHSNHLENLLIWRF